MVSVVEERIGLAPGYAYEVLTDLALPWKVPVMLVRRTRGSFAGRAGDPPDSFRDTEARLSPAGEVALAAERGEIAPVPIGLINGKRLPRRHQAAVPAPGHHRRDPEVIRRPRVPDDEITAIIGPPDFLTGCKVTGDLAALASGDPARLTLRARSRTPHSSLEITAALREGGLTMLHQSVPGRFNPLPVGWLAGSPATLTSSSWWAGL